MSHLQRRARFGISWWVICGSVLLLACGGVLPAFGQAPPTPDQVLQKKLQKQLKELDDALIDQPRSLALHSQRGDVNFYLGNFAAAVSDYDTMVKIDPRQGPSHWRRGIALFYAGRYEEAADQFEQYQQIDNVDRENGIWRFFSQAKAQDRETARQQLLVYEEPDRAPFVDLYRFIAGEITEQELLAILEESEVLHDEKVQQEFYVQLYLGLFHTVENDIASARQHLKSAVEYTWPTKSGFGPHYMWHVARIQLKRLEEMATDESAPTAAEMTSTE